MTYAWPGPSSTSVPSSCLTAIRPEWATPTWRAWQLSVPATGLTHSDHRHPGSNENRAAVVAPMRTTSTCVLSGVRVSSGDSKSRDSTPAMERSSPREIVALPRASLYGEGGPEPTEAVGGPELLGVVVLVEARHSVGQDHPPDLRARVDVHVRRDVGRIVERASANEAHLRAAVLAEDRDLAVRAAEDPLRAAVV